MDSRLGYIGNACDFSSKTYVVLENTHVFDYGWFTYKVSKKQHGEFEFQSESFLIPAFVAICVLSGS